MAPDDDDDAIQCENSYMPTDRRIFVHKLQFTSEVCDVYTAKVKNLRRRNLNLFFTNRSHMSILTLTEC